LEFRLEEKEHKMAQSFWHKVFAKKYRPAWAALVGIIVIAFMLSFPGVRAVATSFLGLFRVEQIEAVQIGISLENLPDEMEQNFLAMDNLLGDQLIVEDVEEPMEVFDLDEASATAGFSVRIPARLAEKSQRYMVQNETSVRLIIDQPQWQSLIDSMGYDYEIPKSADGEEVKFLIPNTVVTGFGDCDVNEANELEIGEGETELSDCTILLQSETPEIEAPLGIDINKAGSVFLQVLGMPSDEAEAFSSRVNWATTLVVPVPVDARYLNVRVDGVEGVLLEDTYHRSSARFTLLWIKDGMFYALTGDGERYSAVGIANSME
jgi:hypothetical protein